MKACESAHTLGAPPFRAFALHIHRHAAVLSRSSRAPYESTTLLYVCAYIYYNIIKYNNK